MYSGNKTKLNCPPPRDVEGEGRRQAEGDIQASVLSVWMCTLPLIWEELGLDGRNGGENQGMPDASDFLSPFP